MSDLYSVLNLSRRASSVDIKAAYRVLAKQFHPDVNAGDKEAEGWTKEINRAYEILGDSDARAAYDLELARQRAKARRSFLSGAAAGAATLILTMGSISMALVWKQHALQTGSAKNEVLVAKAPAQERATLRSARSEHPARGADPGEPVSTPHPRPSSELPASTSSEMTSTARTDRAARTPDAPAPSSVVTEHAPKEAEPSAAPSEPGRTEIPEGQPPPRTKLANVASPEIEAKQPASTAAVDQEPSSEPRRRDGDRKAEAVGSIHKKPKKRLNVPRVAATTTPNRLQGSERDPRLVSSRSTALRWPSAGEPFVNLGVRNR
jgi:curved DNA-binding protein CbpA